MRCRNVKKPAHGERRRIQGMGDQGEKRLGRETKQETLDTPGGENHVKPSQLPLRHNLGDAGAQGESPASFWLILCASQRQIAEVPRVDQHGPVKLRRRRAVDDGRPGSGICYQWRTADDLSDDYQPRSWVPTSTLIIPT